MLSLNVLLNNNTTYTTESVFVLLRSIKRLIVAQIQSDYLVIESKYRIRTHDKLYNTIKDLGFSFNK